MRKCFRLNGATFSVCVVARVGAMLVRKNLFPQDTKSTKLRKQLKVSKVGSSAIAKALKGWIGGRVGSDLSALLSDMSTWTRSMPSSQR